MYFAVPFDTLRKSPQSRLSDGRSLAFPTVSLQVVTVFLLAFLRGRRYAELREAVGNVGWRCYHNLRKLLHYCFFPVTCFCSRFYCAQQTAPACATGSFQNTRSTQYHWLLNNCQASVVGIACSLIVLFLYI
jgi:hypothetical protein